MKVIGVTGGVGCGKSTVLRFLKENYNVCVIEADKVAHQVMEPGQEVYKNVVDEFGSQILTPEKKIDRGILGSMVFGEENREKLNRLNAITHPGVIKKIKEGLGKIKEENKVNWIVVESALLRESGFEQYCDEVWYIYADTNTRTKRLMSNRGYSRQYCENIIKKQESNEFFKENCTRIIDNTKEEAFTQLQIKKALEF